MVHNTGCGREWNPGIGLFWDDRHFAFITGGAYGKIKAFAIRGRGQRMIPAKPFFYDQRNMIVFWIRIVLSKTKIEYFASTQGRQWDKLFEIERSGIFLKPPSTVIIGRGNIGKNPLFSNDEKWTIPLRKYFISELAIGSD